MNPVTVFTRDVISILLLNHTYKWSDIHNDRCKKVTAELTTQYFFFKEQVLEGQ
ncbi:hypothetical protein I79_001253 [Cricetulus griseus]|uniref:Uncharacterized protein n=1 Tax=Cricetulus griseus TaxID=10029 RepID=G3GU99_CRIGR|nr:hypothetical protein I79_001253 [Cricetulus griseus]